MVDEIDPVSAEAPHLGIAAVDMLQNIDGIVRCSVDVHVDGVETEIQMMKHPFGHECRFILGYRHQLDRSGR